MVERDEVECQYILTHLHGVGEREGALVERGEEGVLEVHEEVLIACHVLVEVVGHIEYGVGLILVVHVVVQPHGLRWVQVAILQKQRYYRKELCTSQHLERVMSHFRLHPILLCVLYT